MMSSISRSRINGSNKNIAIVRHFDHFIRYESWLLSLILYMKCSTSLLTFTVSVTRQLINYCNSSVLPSVHTVHKEVIRFWNMYQAVTSYMFMQIHLVCTSDLHTLCVTWNMRSLQPMAFHLHRLAFRKESNTVPSCDVIPILWPVRFTKDNLSGKGNIVFDIWPAKVRHSWS